MNKYKREKVYMILSTIYILVMSWLAAYIEFGKLPLFMKVMYFVIVGLWLVSVIIYIRLIIHEKK